MSSLYIVTKMKVMQLLFIVTKIGVQYNYNIYYSKFESNYFVFLTGTWSTQEAFW